MTVLSEENLIKTLEVAATRAGYKAIMASIGAAERTAFAWRAIAISAKKKDDKSSPFWLEWRGVWGWWQDHMNRARQEDIIGYEALIRQQAKEGILEPVLGPDQRPVYQLDPELIGVDDMDLFLYPLPDGSARKHRYLVDEKGHPVPLMRRVQIPAPLRLRVLEQDPRYKPSLDVTHEHNVTHAPPPVRPPGEEHPSITELRRLASLPPKHRYPQDQHGRLIPVNRGVLPDPPLSGSPPPAPPPPPPPQPDPGPQPPPGPQPDTPNPYARHTVAADQSGYGVGRPAPDGRAVVTREHSLAERRAGTVELTPFGIKRH